MGHAENGGTRGVVLAIIALVTSLIGVSLSRLVYPYDVGYYEGAVWEPSLLAANGLNPYNYALRPPFVMAPYGFLYYLTIGLGLRLFGLQLWLGRLMSILAAAIIVMCIWRISGSLTRKPQAAAFAVVIFLSSVTLQSWIAVQRPDLPGLALAFAGIALVFGRHDRPDKIDLKSLLIASLFAAAFFFKQTFILPPIVAFARYLQMERRKQAIFVLIATVSLCGIGIAALNANAHAGHFWQSVTLTGEIPHSQSQSVQMLAAILKSPSVWVLFIITGLFAFHVFDRRNRKSQENAVHAELAEHEGFSWKTLRSPGLLMCVYFIAAGALAFVTSSRAGANINYYLEPIVAVSIITSIAWAQLSHNTRFNRELPLLLLLFTLSGLFQMARTARGEYYRWRSLPYYKEIVSKLGGLTQSQSVSISVYPELAAAASREYHFGDWIQYLDGRSSELQKAFWEAIGTKNYSAIIWHEKDSKLFPGYTLAPISAPLPERFYHVYLYVRTPYSAPPR
jgi:4-amino-4-deoxy-L-arabinose transferase-like glycosyltransferase